MSTCCCSLAGTKACESCPNAPYIPDVHIRSVWQPEIMINDFKTVPWVYEEIEFEKGSGI